jgi:uncharacterized membrane protein YfcA
VRAYVAARLSRVVSGKLLLRILAGMLVFIAGRLFFEHGDGSGHAVTKP